MDQIRYVKNGNDIFYIHSIIGNDTRSYVEAWTKILFQCNQEGTFLSAQIFISKEVHNEKNFLDILDCKNHCTVLYVDGNYGGIIARGVSKEANAVIKNDKKYALELTYGGTTSIHVSGLSNRELDFAENYNTVFKRLAQIANESNFIIARTWCWLKDILDHYAVFNQSRNNEYKQLGLFEKKMLPASTGVGIPAYKNSHFALDAILYDSNTSIIYHYKTAKQNSAYDYGSAFARMSEVRCRMKRVLYVSGTAAILKDGSSYKIMDVQEQYDNMLENVTAALNEANMDWTNVVYGIVYCRGDDIINSIKDKELFSTYNIIPITATICRDNLLLEMELYASADQ